MRFRLFIFSLVFAGTAIGAHPYFHPDCSTRMALASRRFGDLASAGHWQNHNRHLYEKWVVPVMTGDNPYRQLPAGIPAVFLESLQSLVALNHNRYLTFTLLQELEKEVLGLAEERKITLKEALFIRLAQEESRLGFASAVHTTTFVSKTEFLALLAAGHPIDDEYWHYKPHSRDGHRIQSVIEARYLERLSGRDRVPFIELYRFMGDLSYIPKFDWTGIVDVSSVDPSDLETYPDLWAALHDTPFFTNPAFNFEALDFTNPEFFASLRPLLPGLMGWE